MITLIERLDAYQSALYPAESNHFVDIAALARPNVLFAVARDGTGSAVGCGAIVLEADHGEIKRMFVCESWRGRGLSRRLLSFLEHAARERGCTSLRLETGIHQPEALGLYARAGFMRRGPFGSYREDPLSVFMEKNLEADRQ
ncbi:MAG TPA: GNAT family N-acetyltransferase [Noviherbaspirillum sp.]|nr:GNAT family N-acetyltransferase [Noviherbaspirillum sp.]